MLSKSLNTACNSSITRLIDLITNEQTINYYLKEEILGVCFIKLS